MSEDPQALLEALMDMAALRERELTFLRQAQAMIRAQLAAVEKPKPEAVAPPPVVRAVNAAIARAMEAKPVSTAAPPREVVVPPASAVPWVDTAPPGATFGARVRDRRLALGWTQAELARRMKIQMMDVLRVEQARGAPAAELARAYSTALGVEARALLGGAPEAVTPKAAAPATAAPTAPAQPGLAPAAVAFRAARIERGLSLKRAAALVGVSDASVVAFEKATQPNAKTVAKYFAALGLKVPA